MKNKINPQERKEVINTFNHQKKLIREQNQKIREYERNERQYVDIIKNLKNRLETEVQSAEKVNLYLFFTCFILIIVTSLVLIKS